MKQTQICTAGNRISVRFTGSKVYDIMMNPSLLIRILIRPLWKPGFSFDPIEYPDFDPISQDNWIWIRPLRKPDLDPTPKKHQDPTGSRSGSATRFSLGHFPFQPCQIISIEKERGKC